MKKPAKKAPPKRKAKKRLSRLDELDRRVEWYFDDLNEQIDEVMPKIYKSAKESSEALGRIWEAEKAPEIREAYGIAFRCREMLESHALRITSLEKDPALIRGQLDVIADTNKRLAAAVKRIDEVEARMILQDGELGRQIAGYKEKIGELEAKLTTCKWSKDQAMTDFQETIRSLTIMSHDLRGHQRLVDQRQDVIRAIIDDLRDAVDKRLVAVEQRGFRAWLSHFWGGFWSRYHGME